MAHPVLNAYLDDGGSEIVIVEQIDGEARERRTKAIHATFHRAEDLPPALMRALKASPHVRSVVKGDDGWVRIGWRDAIARRQARYKFKDDGLETFEGDVDPVRFWLTETRTAIARPRRCYLDIETDSRVSFAEKEKMRVLVWAVSDDTGPIARGVLEEDDDDSEATLLEQLWAVLARYDQVCAWFGGDPEVKESGFDFFVVAARTRKLGLPADTRRWLWLDQLVVWRRMNQAESGAEKESMRLEDIAQNQLGEGKDLTPPWVIERFGDKPLGVLSWDLWREGGRYREALVDYCVRDTELLRKLEARKGFLALFQSVCEVTSVFGSTRGLFPTSQMDGFLLRLGREKGYRFRTKTRDDDDGRVKFKGAFVLAPRTVESPPDQDGAAWSKEQAKAWREERGMPNGILRDVHVCDFAALYPSNIITWNLSEEMLVDDPEIKAACKTLYAAGEPIPEGYCYSPGTGVVTRNDARGILPLALVELISNRKRYADEAKKHPPGTPAFVDAMALSNAYKVVANSFYGVAGAATSRFFDVDVARSTTQNGVWLIKSVIREGEKRKMEAVACDTDSDFVVGPTRDGFATFVRWINEKHLPKIIAATGAKESIVKLEFEKTFDILVFSGKKRYVGRFAHFKWQTTCNHCLKKDGKTPGAVDVRTLLCADCGHVYTELPVFIGKPEIKGLEYRRGDWGRFAREMQGHAIDLLVGGLKVNPGLEHLERPVLDFAIYEKLIADWRDRIMSGALRREDVQISKSVKADSEYKKKDDGTTALEAHRAVAKILEARGQAVPAGTKVQYVIVDGSSSPMKVIPAEDFTGECDRYHLWDTLVYPPTQRLLEGAFPDHDWASWADVRPKTQRGRDRVLEGQLGLGLAPKTKAKPLDFSELAVPGFSMKPLVVRVPESAGAEALDRVRAVLLAHPGARVVELVIALDSGAEATLRTPISVSTSPKLKIAVERALAFADAP
jgi:DNA polymerase elongation subunit (family B)